MKCTAATLPVLVGVLLLSARFASLGAGLVPGWQTVAKQFSDSPPSLVQFSNDSPHFRYLLTNKNTEAFTEMVAQGKPLGIRLAGFEGDTARHVVLRCEQILLEAAQHLNTIPDAPGIPVRLSRLRTGDRGVDFGGARAIQFAQHFACSRVDGSDAGNGELDVCGHVWTPTV